MEKQMQEDAVKTKVVNTTVVYSPVLIFTTACGREGENSSPGRRNKEQCAGCRRFLCDLKRRSDGDGAKMNTRVRPG